MKKHVKSDVISISAMLPSLLVRASTTLLMTHGQASGKMAISSLSGPWSPSPPKEIKRKDLSAGIVLCTLGECVTSIERKLQSWIFCHEISSAFIQHVFFDSSVSLDCKRKLLWIKFLNIKIWNATASITFHVSTKTCCPRKEKHQCRLQWPPTNVCTCFISLHNTM